MKKYHINPETGEPGKCSAQTRESCRFYDAATDTDTPHFETLEEAEVYVEKENSVRFKTVGVVTNSVKAESSPGGYKSSPSRRRTKVEEQRQKVLEEGCYQNLLKQDALPDVDSPETKSLKALNHPDLAKLLLQLGEDEGYHKDVYNAVRVSTILHKDQKRFNRGMFDRVPYIEHPLRNAVRINRWGVTDRDVIIAAVLHDSLEDGADTYVEVFENEENVDGFEARGRLSRELESRFGLEVLRLVEAVSNDYKSSEDKTGQSLEEKTIEYSSHVDENLTDGSVYLVKLSDFVDNATGLYHNDLPARREKIYSMAYKYLPVVKVFEDKIGLVDGMVDRENMQKISEQLGRTRVRLQNMINRGPE